MDIKNFVKDYWKIISTIVTIIFMVGFYYNKIQTLDATVNQNSVDIKALSKTVYILVGLFQNENPNINISNYIGIAVSKNLPNDEIINGLLEIKKMDPQTGKKFLMQSQGFDEKQASTIFDQKSLKK